MNRIRYWSFSCAERRVTIADGTGPGAAARWAFSTRPCNGIARILPDLTPNAGATVRGKKQERLPDVMGL